MKHMVRRLVCLATVAGLGFGSQAASVGDELLVNGGFESGSNNPGWTGGGIGDKNSAYKPPAEFFTGNYIGIIQTSNYKQQVFTNDNPVIATLSWRYQHRTSYNPNVPMYYTVLLDGKVIRREEKIADTSSHAASIEGVELAPGEHTLKFQGRTDNNQDSTFFIDDISLTVTAAADFMVLPIPDQLLIGDAVPEPAISVSNVLTGAMLSPGTDYTVAYERKPGEFVARAVVTGINAYEGQQTSGSYGLIPVYHVSGAASDGGTGASWADPMTYTNALKALATTGGEMWIAGTVELAFSPAKCAFPSARCAIRGGFAGTETSPEERPSGTRSTIDGMETYETLRFTNVGTLELERLVIRRSYERGVLKEASNGDLVIRDCRFVENCGKGGLGRAANWYKAGVGGGGASLDGNAVAKLTVVDSDFSVNNSTGSNWHEVSNGGGAFVTKFAEASFGNCTFTNNAFSSGWRNGMTGMGLYSYNTACLSLSGCVFRANVATPPQASIIDVSGGGSRFAMTNCLVVGNQAKGTYGAVRVELSSADCPVTIANSTIAYNLLEDGPGVKIAKGKAKIVDSILFGNTLSATSSTTPSDLLSTGAGTTVAVASSMLTADSVSSLAGMNNGVLTPDPNTCRYGDPLFVTSAADFLSLVKATALGKSAWTWAGSAPMCAIDVHLLSTEGYRKNGDEAWYESEGVQSPAIDRGDSGNPRFAGEPMPNGGRINLGAYGGTGEASKSPTVTVTVSDVSVTFGTEYTQPTVGFTLGGEGAYQTDAKFSFSSDGEAWTEVGLLRGLTNGQVVAYLVPEYLQPGGSVFARVEVEASGGSVSKDSPETPVSGTLPPWHGKGGDPATVVHVRAGATCKRNGTSWTDAYADFETGVAAFALDNTKTELWISGTNLVKSLTTCSFARSCAIRGGFAGTENAIADRRDDVETVLDAQKACSILSFSHSADLVLERLTFRRGNDYGIYRSGGSGNLVIRRCRSLGNSGRLAYGAVNTYDGANGGAGARLVGDGQNASLTIEDCDISANFSASYTDIGNAAGLMIKNFASAAVVNSVFTNNADVGGYRNGATGMGAYAYNTKSVGFTNCVFKDNMTKSIQGTTIGVVGANSASLVNCVVAGNFNGGTAYLDNLSYGTIYVSMAETNSPFVVENCTIAYNLSLRRSAIWVSKGLLAMTNSIVAGNFASVSSACGVDLAVSANGAAKVAYSLFSEEGTNSVSSATNTVELANVIYGDPRLVTSVEDFKTTSKVDAIPRCKANTAGSSLSRNNRVNVHLRGGSGYYDESTGEKVTAYRRKGSSPAIDAGDKSVKCVEPTPNGHRVNLGAYGNTPWATMSKGGTMLMVK